MMYGAKRSLGDISSSDHDRDQVKKVRQLPFVSTHPPADNVSSSKIHHDAAETDSPVLSALLLSRDMRHDFSTEVVPGDAQENYLPADSQGPDEVIPNSPRVKTPPPVEISSHDNAHPDIKILSDVQQQEPTSKGFDPPDGQGSESPQAPEPSALLGRIGGGGITTTTAADLAAMTFPEKLMHLLEKCPDIQDCLWWMPEGDAFCLSIQKFCDLALDKYFQGTKFESLTRKLNRWGFRRLLGQPMQDDVIAYYHRSFQKGKPELLKDMTGGKPKVKDGSSSSQQQQQNELAPSSPNKQQRLETTRQHLQRELNLTSSGHSERSSDELQTIFLQQQTRSPQQALATSFTRKNLPAIGRTTVSSPQLSGSMGLASVSALREEQFLRGRAGVSSSTAQQRRQQQEQLSLGMNLNDLKVLALQRQLQQTKKQQQQEQEELLLRRREALLAAGAGGGSMTTADLNSLILRRHAGMMAPAGQSGGLSSSALSAGNPYPSLFLGSPSVATLSAAAPALPEIPLVASESLATRLFMTAARGGGSTSTTGLVSSPMLMTSAVPPMRSVSTAQSSLTDSQLLQLLLEREAAASSASRSRTTASASDTHVLSLLMLLKRQEEADRERRSLLLRTIARGGRPPQQPS